MAKRKEREATAPRANPRSPSRAAVPAVARVEPVVAAGAITLSLEAALWAALIGLALAMRLASLDHLPLTAGESARAFSAWLVSEGTVPDQWPGDITAALTAHLFRIFGSGETVTRAIPAISGSALILSFWFAGRYVGRGGALLAGAFIAFSPLAVSTSRSAFGFALGGLLSMVMVLSLLTYLEQRRPLPIVILSASFGLALASDPIATSTAIAIVAFLTIEAAWRRNAAVSEAIATFRSTTDHWRPAALALAGTLFLAVVHFGTDIDRLSLAGLRQWLDMFGLPRDDLPWHYQLSLLLAYEWPLFLGGIVAYVVFLYRWWSARQAPSLSQRLLLVWATVALIVVAFATRRESGQVVLLLLPFSLLAATLIEQVVTNLDWDVLKRWWPALALVLALIAYALVQLSRWSRDANIAGSEKGYLVLALMGAAAVLAGGFYYLGRNGLALALPVAAALALPFVIHSSLSLGFGDGAEFAVDTRFKPRIEQLATAVDLEAEQRGSPLAVDLQLRDTLGWYLRNSRVVFGDPPTGSSIVTVAGQEPPGFTPMGGPWRVAEGWIPSSLDPLPAWRWLAHRQPYGNLSTIDLQILVPTQ